MLISISRIILGHCWDIVRISCLGFMYVYICYIYIYYTYLYIIYIYTHNMIYRKYIEYLVNLVSNMVPGNGGQVVCKGSHVKTDRSRSIGVNTLTQGCRSSEHP